MFICSILCSIYSIFSSKLTFKSWILTSENVLQVVQIGGKGGVEVIWTKSKRTSVFPHETVPYVIFLVYTLISPMVSDALDVYIHTCWIGFYLSVRWGFAMKVGFSWYTFIYSGEEIYFWESVTKADSMASLSDMQAKASFVCGKWYCEQFSHFPCDLYKYSSSWVSQETAP